MPGTIAESIAGHAQTLAIHGSKHCTARRLVGHAMKRYDIFESAYVVDINFSYNETSIISILLLK